MFQKTYPRQPQRWFKKCPSCCRVGEGLLLTGQRLNESGLRVLAVTVRQLPSAEGALQAAAEDGIAEGCDSGPASVESLQGGVEHASTARRGNILPSTTNGTGACSLSGSSSPGSRQPGWSVEDERGMTFVGFLAFLDPPKATARQAVHELQARGGKGGCFGWWACRRGCPLISPRPLRTPPCCEATPVPLSSTDSCRLALTPCVQSASRCSQGTALQSPARCARRLASRQHTPSQVTLGRVVLLSA